MTPFTKTVGMGGTSALASAIVAEFFKNQLDEHLAITNAAVGAKCRAVTKTLEKNVANLCSWDTTTRRSISLDYVA